MMKKGFRKVFKILGLIGGVFVLVFGGVKNFWRTVKLVLSKED
jgi:hypothetical protein